MAKLFDRVQVSTPRKNKFDLSHERKLSCNMGYMVPILLEEAVPGDSFKVNTEILMRVAPMLAPMMHRVNVKTDSFFVPTRILWSEFEEWITGGRLGTSAPVHPYFNSGDLAGESFTENRTLADYLGLPRIADMVNNEKISALPFRAYQLIYDEYYRDQNLTPSLDISLASGNIPVGAEMTKLCTMRKTAWEKDYFTSALPFAQRGAAVDVPFGGTAEIVYKDESEYYNAAGGPLAGSAAALPADAGIGGNRLTGGGEISRVENLESIDFPNGLLTINDLRRSIRLQEFLEKLARIGSRYVEMLRGMFGESGRDSRLQRPEYIGGGRTPLRISEVLSTVQQVNPVDGEPIGTPQGDMAGHGIAFGNQHGFRYKAPEHGYFITILRVLPVTAYQEGIRKLWQRFDRLDMYWEQFAQIGEQEVKYKEVFFTGGAGDTPDATFGYQSRYAEMKYGCSSVHGDFKDTLAYWHMGRIFGTQPALNTAFVECDPTYRIFAVDDFGDTDKLWVMINHNISAIRPMPYFGTPTL